MDDLGLRDGADRRIQENDTARRTMVVLSTDGPSVDGATQAGGDAAEIDRAPLREQGAHEQGAGERGAHGIRP